jgi:hypothetical protein
MRTFRHGYHPEISPTETDGYLLEMQIHSGNKCIEEWLSSRKWDVDPIYIHRIAEKSGVPDTALLLLTVEQGL